jgi:hypothetical protein
VKFPNIALFCYLISQQRYSWNYCFQSVLGGNICHSFDAALQRESADPMEMRRAVRHPAIVTD